MRRDLALDSDILYRELENACGALYAGSVNFQPAKNQSMFQTYQDIYDRRGDAYHKAMSGDLLEGIRETVGFRENESGCQLNWALLFARATV